MEEGRSEGDSCTPGNFAYTGWPWGRGWPGRIKLRLWVDYNLFTSLSCSSFFIFESPSLFRYLSFSLTLLVFRSSLLPEYIWYIWSFDSLMKVIFTSVSPLCLFSFLSFSHTSPSPPCLPALPSVTSVVFLLYLPSSSPHDYCSYKIIQFIPFWTPSLLASVLGLPSAALVVWMSVILGKSLLRYHCSVEEVLIFLFISERLVGCCFT